MENRFSKIFAVFLVIALALAFFTEISCGNTYYNRQQEETFVKQPVTAVWQDEHYEYTFTLPDSDLTGKFIAFQNAHFEVEVLIDGETVYELQASNPTFNKSTGYQWVFVQLCALDAGKEFSIRWIPVYPNLTPKDTLYFGNDLAIYKDICSTNGVRFLLSLFILIIGVILLLYGCFIVGIKNADPSLFHFAVFSILLAFWSITESPICDLLNRWPLGAMILDHYALMAMPTVFVMFIRHVFTDKSNPLWNIYLHLNGGIILLRTLLQIISLYDLKQTLWMTQLSIILFTITGVLLGIHELKNFKPTRQMRLNVICLLILFGATLLELLLFRIFQKSSVYGMLGFVFYVVVMSTEIIKKSRKMIARAQEAELYQKLAYTDELTGVYNRMAFRHDMDSQMTLDPATNTYAVKPTTLFMFDLNDLKRCNDTFGHENGDRYIKMISDVLIKAFGIDGKCYRIGGDEFSAIMPNVNQNEIDNKLITILRSVQELNNAGFVVPVSVAVGYSVFDPEQDKTLDDTLKRADELMYQNKLKIKQALHAM